MRSGLLLERFALLNNELRCDTCRRLLLKMEDGAICGSVSIKCPRCGAFNNLRPIERPFPKRPDRDEKDAFNAR
ncbi:MAG: Com family DNA-binding transcriptional regulator [Paracoccaceae bacterium]